MVPEIQASKTTTPQTEVESYWGWGGCNLQSPGAMLVGAREAQPALSSYEN